MHKGNSRSTTIPISRRWALLAALFCLLVISACGRQVSQTPQLDEAEQIELLLGDPTKETELGSLDGQTVSGKILVSLNDRRNLEYVDFFLNDREGSGTPLGTDDTNPYTFEFDTTTVANGEHTITAIGFGKNGRVRAIGHATFTVENPSDDPSVDEGDEGEDEGEAGGGEDEGEAGGGEDEGEEEESPASDKLTVVAVSASSHDGNGPENTLDGDLNTRWSARGVGEWIQFDLGAEQEVNHVAVAWYRGDARTSSFEIHLSNDASSWNKVFEGVSSGTTLQLEEYTFEQAQARYVRIVGLGNSNNSWNSITIVDLYGNQVTPVDDSTPAPGEPEPEPEPTPPNTREALSLRGDPNFSESQLSDEARLWYRRVWAAINNPNQIPDATSRAASDNIYHYARDLYTHYLALLTAFRVTGDLRLLDEVDRLAQIQRSKLADGWRGTLDGTDGTQDGYLNWVDRYLASTNFRGKDLTEYNEARAHSILAMLAYTFDLNRDLVSPAGVDYGERADFWQYYLLEHFEPKWRGRNNVPPGEFPFIIPRRSHTHSSISTIMYHHYMFLLTGDVGYFNEVKRQTDRFFHARRIVNIAGHDAFVWRRHLADSADTYLMPTTYARYVMADAVDYHLEGVYRWNGADVPVGFANTLAHILMDNGAIDLARDVGGGVERAGYEPAPPDWDRLPASVYVVSPYAWVAPWDVTGKAISVSLQMYQNAESSPDNPRRIYVPVAMLLNTTLKP
jgi:hypothetical protein